MNTSEELTFVKEVAESTGVVLDPVYRYLFVVYIAYCQSALFGSIMTSISTFSLTEDHSLYIT